MIDQTGTISLKYFDLAERPADDAPVDDLNGFIVVPTGDVVRITEDASTDEGFREEAVGVCKRTLRGSGALPLYDLECKVGEQDYSIKMIDSSISWDAVTGASMSADVRQQEARTLVIVAVKEGAPIAYVGTVR